MSIWTRIAEALRALARGEGLSVLFDRPRAPERSVAFTIAVIALGAKMAKADGRVTRDEVTAFREVFTIPPGEETHAAQVFDLARQDVAGFDAYARQIARMFGPGHDTLWDLTEGLFHIAVADGRYHPREDAYLAEVAAIFGLDARAFRALRARFVPDEHPDPHEVLGVTPDTPLPEIRRAWHRAARACHPDGLAARGLPREAVRLAERRLADLNRAWEEIEASHRALPRG